MPRGGEAKLATIYVSYRSSDEPFVRAVVDRLETRHDVRIDYHIPAGADWRSPDPACSAVMTHAYSKIQEFPVWFFNLPAADGHVPQKHSTSQPTGFDRLLAAVCCPS